MQTAAFMRIFCYFYYTLHLLIHVWGFLTGVRVLPRLLELSQKFLANEGKTEWQLSEGSNQQTKHFQHTVLFVLFSLLPRHLLKYVSVQDNPGYL